MSHFRFLRVWLAVVFILFILTGPTIAQEESTTNAAELTNKTSSEETDSILIRNVHLIGRQGGIDNVLVNLLIVNGKLLLVTKDNIPTGISKLALDAEKGFLMGNLDLGAQPSFVIVNENPRDNPEVFLNSIEYVVFAMKKGVLIKNFLPNLPPGSGDDGTERSGWTSYNPPPMAVPLNYYDSRKWNKFETDFISGLFTGAVALDRLRWLSQDDPSKTQLGDLSESAIGAIRGLRFGLVGTINFAKPWIYTIFFASAAFDKGFNPNTRDDLILFDARLDIPLPGQINLSIGKQKEPISLERLTMIFFIPWQERSAPADAFIPSRNYGIVLNSTAFNERTSWAAGFFNNWVDARQSFENTSSQITGRFTGLPFLSTDESNLLHLGVGLRYSDIKQPIRGKTEAEFYASPIFVDTDSFQADDLMMYNVELYWRKGQYLLGCEYIGVKTSSPDFNSPFFYGYNISASWVLTGEMRQYRKKNGIFAPIPVSIPVDQSGWGAWELAVRYSTIDLVDGLIDGGKMDTYSAALNWWLNPKVQFGLNYRYVLLDRFGVDGKSSGLNLRLSLILE